MHLTAFYCKLICFTVCLFKWQIWHPFYVSFFDIALIQFTNWGGFSLCSKSEIVSVIKVVRFPPPLNVSNIIFVLHLSHLLLWIWEIGYLINCQPIIDLDCFIHTLSHTKISHWISGKCHFKQHSVHAAIFSWKDDMNRNFLFLSLVSNKIYRCGWSPAAVSIKLIYPAATPNLLKRWKPFLILSLAYKTRFHLIFRLPAWSKRNIILTVTAQSNHFLHSKAINKHFWGGNRWVLEHLK